MEDTSMSELDAEGQSRYIACYVVLSYRMTKIRYFYYLCFFLGAIVIKLILQNPQNLFKIEIVLKLDVFFDSIIGILLTRV